jgi:PAS domain S-box-containing protein
MIPLVPGGGNLLTNILEATPDIVFIYNLECKCIIYANRQLEEILGYSFDELKVMEDKFLDNIGHPEEAEIRNTCFKDLDEINDEQVIRCNIRLKKSNDEFGWFRVRNKVFSRTETGEVKQVISITTDITDEMNMQLKLHEEEARFKAIYNNTSDLNFFIDTSLFIITVNKTAIDHIETTTGKKIETGKSLLEYFPAELHDAIMFKVNEAMEGTRSQLLQSYKDEAGHNYWLKSRYYPIYNHSGTLIGVNVSCRDVSDLVNANIILEKQNKQLKEIARMNAHEIRKPLTNILGLIHLVELEHQPNLTTEVNELFDHLKFSSNELDDVIRKIVNTASAS